MKIFRWLKLVSFSIAALLTVVSTIGSNFFFVNALAGVDIPLVNDSYLEEVVFICLLGLWCIIFLKSEPNWARIGLIIIIAIIIVKTFRTEVFYYSHHIFQFPQIVG